MSSKTNYQISGLQAAALAAMCASFGINTAASDFSASVIPSAAISAVLSVLVLFFALHTFSKCGFSSLTSAMTGSYGRVISGILLAAMGGYFILQASSGLALRSRTISMYLLPDTPQQIVLFAAVIVCALLFFSGLRQLASTAELLSLMLLLPIIVLLVLGLSGIDVQRLRPLTVSTGFSAASALSCVRSFHGFEIFLFCLGAEKLRSKDANKLYGAFAFCVICFMSAFLISVGTLSLKGADSLLYPLNEAFRVLNVGKITLSERFDLLLLSIDLISGLVSTAAFMYGASVCLSSSFGLTSHRSTVSLILPAVFLLSCGFARSSPQWVQSAADIGFCTITLLIIPLLCFIALMKRRNVRAA